MSGAYEIIEGWSRPDGQIEVQVSTNDNLDLGYPSEYSQWSYVCKNREAFDKRCGKSHYGCSGIKVMVMLDGKEVR